MRLAMYSNARYHPYGVATISRLLQIICLFCKRALKKTWHSAKETYTLKEPTNCSHPIAAGRVTRMCVTWLIHVHDMTHSYVWHDSFICVTWLIHMCDMTHSYVWHDLLACVAWLLHECDTTLSRVWHDSFHVWRDSFMCVTWLIHMCNKTHSNVWHDLFICTNESCHTYEVHTRARGKWKIEAVYISCQAYHTYEWVMSHIWMSHVTHGMSHVTHIDASCHTYEWVMSHIWMSHITHMNESWMSHGCVMSHI